jgi:hypothetical protein
VTPVLTVRQPWASALLRTDDRKTIENRTWPTALRGTIAIHAGAALDDKPRGNPWLLDRAWGRAQPADLERGAVIGTVRIVDCHMQGDPSCECDSNPWAEFGMRDLGQKPVFHWITDDPRDFVTPIPARGALGLWHPGPSLEHLIAIAEVQQ